MHSCVVHLGSAYLRLPCSEELGRKLFPKGSWSEEPGSYPTQDVEVILLSHKAVHAPPLNRACVDWVTLC